MLRAVGIFVQLRVWDSVAWERDWERCYYHPDRHGPAPWADRAGPDGFVVDPEAAPELVAHQREHLRRVLDATGDLGNVWYELASGIGGPFGESGAWVEAMLDEVAAWEERTGRDVLVGIDDGGRDRAGAGFALGNPRLDLAFVPADRPDLHRELRGKYGKPTVAARSSGFQGRRDPSLVTDRADLAAGLRVFWRLFTVRSQMAALPADFGRCAYRACALSALSPVDLPGAEMPELDASFSRADVSPERIVESPAPVAGALIASRRRYFVADPQVKRATVFLECAPGESGVEVPGGTLRVDGVEFLAAESPFRIRARSLRLDTGESVVSTYPFERDDLVMEVPAFRDGLVITLRQGDLAASFAPSPAAFREPLPERTPVRISSVGQAVTLEWDRNPAAPDWTESVAWIQRFPDGAWVARTSGRSFVDPEAMPGRVTYAIDWRDAAGVVGESVPGNPEAATMEIPDAVPAAPLVVPVFAAADSVGLWAKSEPAADLARWEWERRWEGEAWEPLAVTDAFLLRGAAPAAPCEVRVRVVDAAGQAGPFSDPVSVAP